jgi:hypothetical protein
MVIMEITEHGTVSQPPGSLYNDKRRFQVKFY